MHTATNLVPSKRRLLEAFHAAALARTKPRLTADLLIPHASAATSIRPS
jgi:hypothetical protein